MNQLLKDAAIRLMSVLRRDNGPKVVFYHDVFQQEKHYLHATSLALFEKHLDIIRNEGWRVTSSLPVKEKDCMITFDDGFRGIWECRDFFYERNIRPTVFIAVELVGQDHYLNWKEVLELQAHGFVFECHTWTHRRVTEVPRSELQRELSESRDFLCDKLGKNVTQLCFPQGRFNEDICKMCVDYGYEKLFSCIYGNADKTLLPNLICRNLVQEVDEQTFLGILRGGANPSWRRYYKMHCVPGAS